jgi:hypothetical protein
MSMATNGTQDDELGGLLARMPEIAKAVSAFPEGVQQSAFDALIAAATGAAAPTPTSPTADQEKRKKPTTRKRQATGDDMYKPRRARRTAGAPTQLRDLDLAPNGKKSLREFAEEKKPATNHDYNVVSVYYLTEELGISEVTLNHVFTCYRDRRWKEPANLPNSLALTSSRKRYLDTSNLDDIKLTPAGRTRVEHGLPTKAK